MSGRSNVLLVSTDRQGSATWWADRLGENIPFDFTQEHEEPGNLKNLLGLGAKIHVIANQKGGVGKTTIAVTSAAIVVDTLGKTDDGYKHIFIDTPGKLDQGEDTEEDAEMEAMLQAALAIADDILVPLPPEPLTFDPTRRSMEKFLKVGKPLRVVVNNWDPRDGTADRDETIGFIENQGWPRAETVIRRYKVHTRASAEGKVITQYPPNRATFEARQDFYKLALELGWGGAL